MAGDFIDMDAYPEIDPDEIAGGDVLVRLRAVLAGSGPIELDDATWTSTLEATWMEASLVPTPVETAFEHDAGATPLDPSEGENDLVQAVEDELDRSQPDEDDPYFPVPDGEDVAIEGADHHDRAGLFDDEDDPSS